MRVVVIGAGLGGLSAACHLVGRGHEVTVVERERLPGGLAGTWCSAGYRIDTGPSVLTMSGVLEDTFAAAGAEMSEHLSLRRLDPIYRACFDQEEPIYVRFGREAMTEEIASKCGESEARAFGRFSDWLAGLYRLEFPNFIARNYDSPLDLARPLLPAVKLARAGALRRMGVAVAGYFTDPRLRKLFSFQALYAGLSPMESLAIYCVITYMDTIEGVWFPTGGMHSVPIGLARAAEKAGAEFRYGSTVSRILRRPGANGAANGVELASGERVLADAVVSDVDPVATYTKLLAGASPPRVARRGEYSPSCVLWTAGVTGAPPPGAAHHNIHFGCDWSGSFQALLHDGVRQSDPSMLVSLPAVSEPALAPPGGQVVYALEPVPNLDGHIDWLAQREAIKESLLARLDSFGYPLATVTERFIDPLDWEAQGLHRGTPFSLSHRFFQSGPWRPTNRPRQVRGLVLVGSGTVPGVGVPMVLVSGRLAAERIEQMAAGR